MEKVCLTELKKIINEEKNNLKRLNTNDYDNRSATIFVDKDEDSQTRDNSYNYFSSNEGIQKSMLKIIKLTSVLNKETSTTLFTCDSFTGTISEAILLLKYYNDLNRRLEEMLYQQKTQTMSYDGKVTKKKYFYDLDYVEEKHQSITKKIQKLQMGIDKAMLSNEVSIPEYDDELHYKIFGV